MIQFNNNMRFAVEGLLWGVAVGDAFGIPFEGHTGAEIRRYLDDHPGCLNAPYVKPWANDFLDVETHRVGGWTDDTQLAFAVVRGLTRAKTFDLDEIAQAHVEEMRLGTNGWGTGTRISVEHLANGARGPRQSGNPDSCGNGVLIKTAPLAFYYAFVESSDEILTPKRVLDVESLARMTHDNELSAAVACFHVFFMATVFRSPTLFDSPAVALETAHQLARRLEKDHFPSSDLVRRLLPLLGLRQRPSDEELLSASNGASFHHGDSSIVVWAILLFDGIRFGSILRAATIGGDCDSNASMVASVVGCLLGKKVFDEQDAPFVESLLGGDVVRRLVDDFCLAFDL